MQLRSALQSTPFTFGLGCGKVDDVIGSWDDLVAINDVVHCLYNPAFELRARRYISFLMKATTDHSVMEDVSAVTVYLGTANSELDYYAFGLRRSATPQFWEIVYEDIQGNPVSEVDSRMVCDVRVAIDMMQLPRN